MKIQIFLIIVIFIFISCGDLGRGKTKKEAEDSIQSKSLSSNKDFIFLNKKRSDTVAIVSHKDIIGLWKESNYKEELTLEVSQTKFIYKEHHESYRYRIDKDSIHLYFRETTISGKPYFVDDTLLIRSPNGDFKYVKIK